MGVPELVIAEVGNWLNFNTINHKETFHSSLSKGYDFRVIAQMAADHLGVLATLDASELDSRIGET
jgi:hypothetical protein